MILRFLIKAYTRTRFFLSEKVKMINDVPKEDLDEKCAFWIKRIESCQTKEELANIEYLVNQYFLSAYPKRSISKYRHHIIESLLIRDCEIDDHSAKIATR